jgi:disulfide oxidoreductase YuzD
MSNGYVEPVTEIPKLLREFIKKKYPNYKFSVTRTNYNSINVDLFEADFDAFVTDIKNTPINPFYIQNDTNLTADAKKVMQDIYDFLSPNEYKNSGAYNFYLTMNVGRNAIPYKNVGKKSYSTKGSSYSSTSNAVYDKGTLIRTCGGWELYRAMTKTNKVVYNAIKLPYTPLNKTDWDVIKGEITTETGFKYQYGAFTKWGIIDDSRIDKLCELFEKYYTNQSIQNTTNAKPTTPQTTSKVLSKADFERRIKGVELLLKNTNDTLEIIKYNKKLKGLRLLLKNS